MRRRILIGVAAGLGVVVIIVLAAIFVITRTDWGRERVRHFAVDAVQERAAGTVSVGHVRGNLLTGVTLEDVEIVDEAGRPFIHADEISTRYSIRGLLSRRVILTDLRLVRAVVVLDQPPDEDWNFVRIFPPDTVPTEPDPDGFGSFIVFRDVEIEQSRVQIRSEWEPPDTLSPAQRGRAIEDALAGRTRTRVVEVPGGYQALMDFHTLNAELPLVRLAHPDSTDIVLNVARLSSTAAMFEPPLAQILDLSGVFTINSDVLFGSNLVAVLPDTRLTGGIVYEFATDDFRLQLRGDPLAFADMRWLYPPLPEEGGGRLELGLVRDSVHWTFAASELDLRVRESAVAGALGLTVGDTLALRDTDLRFTSLDTRLIERLAPDIDVPRHGTLDGRIALAGDPTALRLDGNVTFTDPISGTSRVRADGLVSAEQPVRMRELRLTFDPLRLDLVRAFQPDLPLRGSIEGRATLNGIAGGRVDMVADVLLHDPAAGTSQVEARGGILTGDVLGFRELRLRFDPLQVALARTLVPDLPLGGTVRGMATLNGSPATRIDADGNLVHVQAGERSHVAGSVVYAPRGRGWIDANVRLLELSLPTIGRVAGAELHGTAAGRVRATGGLNDLRLDADLSMGPAGALAVAGRLGVTPEPHSYDLTASFADFDPGRIMPRAPHTALTGTLTARGRGLEPATMDALFEADLTGVPVPGTIALTNSDTAPHDELRVDTIRLRALATGGLATIERATARLASASLEVQGTFGLAPDRSGELTYRLAVDSLSDFERWAPPADTGVVPPRPALQAREIARARADSLRIARATEVERRATGQPPLPTLDVDAIRPIPRDSLAGRIYAEGQLRGNISRFDLSGEAEVEGLVLAGHAARAGHLEYDWRGAGQPEGLLELDATFDSLRAAGFALDSMAAEVEYRGSFVGPDRGGTLQLQIFQDDDRDYSARADFVLALDRSEIQLHEMALRFDTLHWTMTTPGAIRWGKAGLAVDDISLHSDDDGRIALDGQIPPTGQADLRVELERVEIAHIVALIQGDQQATGLLSLHANLRGTRASPSIEGEAALVRASLEGRELPDIVTRFDYADTSLRVEADVRRAGRQLAVADARLPIDLAINTDGPRLLDGAIEASVRADSLPLDALPSFSDDVDDVSGRAVGRLDMTGTFGDPVLNGEWVVDLARFRVVPIGVTYHDIAGTLRLADDVLTVDSLVARAGGPLRLTGTMDLADLTAPGFDLRLVASDARLLDTEDGQVRATAELTIVGPFDGVVVEGGGTIESGVLYVPEANGRMVSLDDPVVTQVADTLTLERRELIPPRNPLLDNLQVDVAFDISRDFWVRSTDMNLEVYTPPEAGALRVQLDQRTNTLVLLGSVNTDRGEYTAMGRRFQITRGGATFLGDTAFDPLLHLIAEHEVSLRGRPDLRIHIHVGGTLTAPTLSLESDAQPPLSQTDLLSYLAFGRSSSSLLTQQGSGLSGQAGAGELVGGVAEIATRQLASVAIGALVQEFESDAARSLGLDVFRVSPADVPAELSFGGVRSLLLGTELEAGKYLTSRWFVAGQARPTFVRPGALVEYRTPRGFRWVLSYEPRFLPVEPTFSPEPGTRTTGVVGAFLRWEWRY